MARAPVQVRLAPQGPGATLSVQGQRQEEGVPARALPKGGSRSRRKPRKQAVVVFHGMGEQRPMETLRGFVETVWANDPRLCDARWRRADGGNRYWNQPDARTGSHELRRLTTPASAHGVRTDFYECYWADIMQGTLLDHVLSWVWGLLLRHPRAVPRDVAHAWIVLWVLSLTVAYLALASTGVALADMANWPLVSPLVSSLVAPIASAIGGRLVPPLADLVHHPAVAPLLGAPPFAWAWAYLSWLGALDGTAAFAAMAMLGVLTHRLVVPYFGDVARYVVPLPDNVGRRKEVLDRGLALLKALHEKSGGTPSEYGRIVVVGHSLGSVVAYDCLSHYWAEQCRSWRLGAGKPVRRAFENIERFYAGAGPDWPLPRALDRRAYRRAQKRLFDALRSAGCNWLVSDFVTLGSPLTHAEFLLARDNAGFRAKLLDRELPACPPMAEPDPKSRGRPRIIYQPGRARHRLPHHATPFAVVRWTNIYCRHRLAHLLLLPGDLVSGPVGRHFGTGVLDKRVWIWSPWLGFAHTYYWRWRRRYDRNDPPRYLRMLRKAVNLENAAEPFTAGELADDGA